MDSGGGVLLALVAASAEGEHELDDLADGQHGHAHPQPQRSAQTGRQVGRAQLRCVLRYPHLFAQQGKFQQGKRKGIVNFCKTCLRGEQLPPNVIVCDTLLAQLRSGGDSQVPSGLQGEC